MAELDIALLRMVQLWCAAVLFGVPLFSVYGPHEALRQTRHVVSVAAIGMIIASIAAVTAQTASLIGAPFTIPDAIWYLTDTRIGNVFAARLATLLGYIWLIACMSVTFRRSVIQIVLGGLVLGSFGLTGHGAGNAMHALADVLHLLAAGIWFGALLGLCALLLRAHKDQELIASTAHGLQTFSKIGSAVVAILVLSGTANALFAFGLSNAGTILQGSYGQLILLKLALLACMLALAYLNRFKLTPQLEKSISSGDNSASLRRLRYSMFSETSLALIVLGVAATLASTPPPG